VGVGSGNRDPRNGNGSSGALASLVSRLPRIPLARRAKVGANQLIRKQVPNQARHAFRVDLIASLLAGLYTGAVFPFIGVIARRDLHANSLILALMIAAPFIGNLMALFWAQAMEGRKKVPFVKWAHTGARLMVMLSFFAVGAWPFALVMSGCQIIGTIAMPAYAAIMKDVYPDDQRGKLLGLTRAAILAAQIASTLFASWLLTFVSYRVVFPIAALIGIAAALIFSRINPAEDELVVMPAEKPSPAGGRLRETGRFVWSTLGILRDDQAYRWFALSVFTYGFGNLLTVPIIPIIQVDLLNMDTNQVGLLFNLMQVVAIFGYLYWGRYVDQRSPQRAVVLNVLLNCLIPVVYMATAIIPGANAWALLPAYVVSGLVLAGIDMSYFNALLTFAGPDNVSRYQALQSFLLGIRGTIAPFIGGALGQWLVHANQDRRWVFLIGLVFMLVGAWMQTVAMKRQEQHKTVMDMG
jgi:MFS family permease